MVFIRPKDPAYLDTDRRGDRREIQFMLNEERKADEPDLLKAFRGERPPILPPLPASVTHQNPAFPRIQKRRVPRPLRHRDRYKIAGRFADPSEAVAERV